MHTRAALERVLAVMPVFLSNRRNTKVSIESYMPRVHRFRQFFFSPHASVLTARCPGTAAAQFPRQRAAPQCAVRSRVLIAQSFSATHHVCGIWRASDQHVVVYTTAGQLELAADSRKGKSRTNCIIEASRVCTAAAATVRCAAAASVVGRTPTVGTPATVNVSKH